MAVVKSINSLQCTGEVTELNFTEETKEVELKDKNGNGHKVTCGVITKADFSNPNMTVNSDGNIIPLNWFQQTEKIYDKNNKLVDNPRFKELKTIMDYEIGTRVRVDGSFADGGYASKSASDGKIEWVDKTAINVFKCTSTKVPEDDYCDADLTCVIRNIEDEKHFNEATEESEDTGRLLLSVVYFDYAQNAIPMNLVVPEDLAEGFKEIYNIGDSAKLNVEVVTERRGVSSTSSGFGNRKSNKVSGYTVTEYRVFGGCSRPLTDDTDAENFSEVRDFVDYVVTKEEAKAKLNEREVMKEQKCKEREKRESEGGKSTSTRSKGLSNRASNKKEDEFCTPNEDDPFDDPF